MKRALDLIVQPGISPQQSLATDHLLLARAGREGRGALRVYTVRGSGLSLGRYHLAPAPPAGCATRLSRRHSGGRAVPAGDGFLGISLVLPHRSALVADEPLALDPSQVLNRGVRGILEACRLAGIPAHYPGRDTLTVGGRILALVSFEVDAGGRCLIEAIVAGARDFAELPALLDAADPQGIVPAAMLGGDDTTSLARERGTAPALAHVAAWLGQGHEARLGVRVAPQALTAEELRTIDALAADVFADERWLAGRRPRPDLARRASVAGQLGIVEAHHAVADGRIQDIVLTGDFIANSLGVAALEATLRGCPLSRSEIARRVHDVLGRPGNLLLGLGAPAAAAEALARGLVP